MNLKEQYKHLLNYGANLITLLVEGLCFGYIWYIVYEEQFGFWRRGNWAVVGLYVLVIFFFTKVFGGYNIGYMRMTDIALSHILSILLSGFVGYLELCLICRDYVEPAPMLVVMAVETGFILPWIYIIRKLYTKLYPPRQMLVIYGHYAPDELILKINTRRDKYNICGSVSYEIGHEALPDDPQIQCGGALRSAGTGEKPDHEVLLPGVDPDICDTEDLRHHFPRGGRHPSV